MNANLVRRLSILIAGIGLVDSAYLAWIKLSNNEILCAGIGECDVVNSSIYAEIGGIPIALLGAAAYAFLIFLYIVETRAGFWADNAGILNFGLTLAGVLYSAYLTYIEVAVLKAICPFCVVSAVAMLALFVLAVWRMLAAPPD
ncbi:MAG: vitamin K epoxide reductase family protein [Chloroflexi bacterium]|nr:vitamin K epoxide reductase family protein [Chloroflexota bacterium]